MATGLLLATVTLVLAYAQTEVLANGAAIAPAILLDEWEGIAAPTAIMQRSDLLPMFGSSELIVPMTNRATDFFASYPTGFAVAPIGARGFPILSMAVALGSLGNVLRDRRLVISLSGTWLAGDQPQYAAVNFRWHYSSLQTGDLVFRSALPLALKRHFARRILTYKSAGDIDPLVATALSCLARECAFEPLLPALAPLWMLESLPTRTRDVVHLAAELRHATPTVRRGSRPNWNELEARSDSVWRAHSTNNAFGIEDSIWMATRAKILARGGTMSDSTFIGGMQRSPDWEDLELLLATMKQLGARPLILSTPLKGAYWNHLGVSTSARDRMYRRFDSATAPFHFPARSFSERDSDVAFLSEPRSHLSAKGWLVYDRTIDAFYHDTRP